jgi:predicted phosphoadenosine phosphosulfate sulfurtransferase
MKIYSKNNVLVEAEKRIHRLFDDFENVVVGFSGGKDSTVCLNLTLKVAEERNRLPLKVLWVDQEAEWQGTADYCESVFDDKRIEPMWFQMPMKWFNNVSSNEKYIHIWKDGAKHMRERSDKSIKENVYLDFGFHELFKRIFDVHFPDEKSCYISGVRTEESPNRMMSLTSSLTYKDITWGKILDKTKEHYTFYPIYDWSYSDVWKYIFDNNIVYNRIYDALFTHGVGVLNMRISNLHHETAIQNLLLIQEIEPDTWNKIAERHDGTNAIKHLKSDAFKCPKDLPYMFKSWKEYALYLAENMTSDDQFMKNLHKKIDKNKKYMVSNKVYVAFYRKVIDTILSQDFDFTKLTNFLTNPYFNTVKKYVNGKLNSKNIEINRKYDKYVKGLI